MAASRHRLSVTVCALLFAPAFLHAQDPTATLSGRVADNQGNLLQQVQLTVRNLDTGQSWQTRPTQSGIYLIGIAPGDYELTFVAAGWKRLTFSRIHVRAQDRLRLDVTLERGEGDAPPPAVPQADSQLTGMRSTIGRTWLDALPLINRNLVPLVTLTPGVSSDLADEVGFRDDGTPRVSIAGGRRSSVAWLLDGASLIGGLNNARLIANPAFESIQEIDVATTNYGAAWPSSGDGVVQVITRTGGATVSGSAYEFARTDQLNSSSFFIPSGIAGATNAPPRLRYHNFGYSAGGPIAQRLSSLRFFFSEEWRRSSGMRRVADFRVPDPTWLTNPASPNYVAPADRDPIAVKLLQAMPSPNVDGTNLLRTRLTARTNTEQETARVDFPVGERWLGTARYTHDLAETTRGLGLTLSAQPIRQHMPSHIAAVSVRRVAGNWLAEGAYRLSQASISMPDAAVATHTRDALGISIPEVFPENQAGLIPNVSIPGLSFNIGDSQPTTDVYRNSTLSGDIGVTKGAHAIRAGALLVFENVDFNFIGDLTQGSFSFRNGGGFTAFQNFLRGNAAGTCGAACTYFEIDRDVSNRLRMNRYDAYLQDSWRASSQLTVDAGVRYSLPSPITDKNNTLVTFVPQEYDARQAPAFADPFGFSVFLAPGTVATGLRVGGVNSPYGRALYARDTNNVQPRTGVAWDMTGNGRLVLHGGYGLYFDDPPMGLLAGNAQVSIYNPFERPAFYTNARLANPLTGTRIPVDTSDVPDMFATGDLSVTPRRQQWDIGVRQRLYSRGNLDVAYVGARGDHLLRLIDINQPQPAAVVAAGGNAALARPFQGYGSIIMREPTGRERYRGLLTRFSHDGGRRGSLIVNYTWSQNMADATENNESADNPQNPLDLNGEFALARTDRLHVLRAAYVYELPFFHDQVAHGWKRVLTEWQLAGITTIESGPPARVQAFRFGSGFPAPRRPNQGGDPRAGEQQGLLWFDPTVFQPPPDAGYGTAPVAPFRLPGRHQWDVSLAKTVDLPAASHLQVRVDLINAFNHTQPLQVDTMCIGTSNCSGNRRFGQIVSAHQPRELQLGIRFDW